MFSCDKYHVIVEQTEDNKMATIGGTIRMKLDKWEILTKLAVKCSMQLQRPVNQSEVLHSILDDCLENCTPKEICETIRGINRKQA